MSGLFRKSFKSLCELYLIRLAHRLDGERDDRLGEYKVFEKHGTLFIAERIAGADLFEARDGDDEAGLRALHFLTLVGVHAEYASDSFTASRIGIVDGHAVLYRTGVDTAEGETTDERVDHDLEGESANGSLASALISISFDVSSGSTPITCGISSGLGRYSTTASSNG